MSDFSDCFQGKLVVLCTEVGEACQMFGTLKKSCLTSIIKATVLQVDLSECIWLQIEYFR